MVATLLKAVVFEMCVERLEELGTAAGRERKAGWTSGWRGRRVKEEADA